MTFAVNACEEVDPAIVLRLDTHKKPPRPEPRSVVKLVASGPVTQWPPPEDVLPALSTTTE